MRFESEVGRSAGMAGWIMVGRVGFHVASCLIDLISGPSRLQLVNGVNLRSDIRYVGAPCP